MTAAHDTKTPQKSIARVYILLFSSFSMLLVALVSYFLQLTYRQTERSIEIFSLNEAHVLSARTDTVLRHIESTCSHVAEHFLADMRDNKKLTPLPEPIDRVLASLTNKFPEILQVQAFDVDGSLTFSSLVNPPIVSIADREHFRESKERPDTTIRFTNVLQLKSTGSNSVLAYRSIVGPRGEFLGMVTSAIDLAYFAKLFSELDMGNTGMRWSRSFGQSPGRNKLRPVPGIWF